MARLVFVMVFALTAGAALAQNAETPVAEPTISIEAQDMDVREALKLVAPHLDDLMLVAPSVPKTTVTVFLYNVSPQAALHAIAEAAGLVVVANPSEDRILVRLPVAEEIVIVGTPPATAGGPLSPLAISQEAEALEAAATIAALTQVAPLPAAFLPAPADYYANSGWQGAFRMQQNAARWRSYGGPYQKPFVHPFFGF